MAFKTRKTEEFTYTSPQEMYQDNKLKKIMGPLDYQAAMLDLYVKNFDKKSIALELPTGSGKTLVGLLIAEYRRRKNKEKVLFLCPTNQLVHQVVEQANEKYGLKAIAFCGKQKEYLPKDKSSFLLADAIGVTTYSSFFSLGSFFSDIDILIMDDVHSSEDYVISNWTIKITDADSAFEEMAELLKPFIGENNYLYLTDEPLDPLWCDLVPISFLTKKVNEMQIILQQRLDVGSSNYYAYSRISENLEDCNIYIAKKTILIRPWVAPTLTFSAFAKAKQKVLMSATLGRSGELERVTGIEKIERLPIVNDWDKKGLGRRFFTFPDLSLGEEAWGEVIFSLQNRCKKSVFLVPDTKSAKDIIDFYTSYLSQVVIFNAKDIEESKQQFVDAPEASVILANRFDGIDFPDDESRLLFILNLPKTTNLQEMFLSTKMGASQLYAERIRTRIIQAVGRCSRNPSDYSIVCVIGNTVQNELTKKEKLRQFPPELRAELNFGLENSLHYSNVDEIIEQANDFFSRSDNWQDAEEYIVELRNGYWNEKNEADKLINNKLSESSKFELEYQYALWKKDYETAFNKACEIIKILDAPALSGYKCFWNYLSGCMAYYLLQKGRSEYKDPSIRNFAQAIRGNIKIKWLPELSKNLFSDEYEEAEENDFFFDCIERIERLFTTIKTPRNLEKKIAGVLDNLKSEDGKVFENGHKDFGELLGYISINPNNSGAPDPYWIINENNVIVSEDKIYKEREQMKCIPISDVSEAARHLPWIIANVKQLSKGANIYTVFITNSNDIDNEARIYADGILYVNRQEFVKWATNALTIVRNIWNTFNNEGEMNWRKAVHQEFKKAMITPKDYLDFIRRRYLKEL